MRELLAALERRLRARGIVAREVRRAADHVRRDGAGDRAELLRERGAARRERLTLGDVATLHEQRAPRDIHVEHADRIAVLRERARTRQRGLGLRELPEPGEPDGEEAGEDRAGHGVGAPGDDVERLFEQTRAFSELAAEHAPDGQERIRDRVCSGIAERGADLRRAVDRALELGARFGRLPAHPAEEGEREVDVPDQLRVAGRLADRERALEPADALVLTAVGPGDFARAECRA